MIARTRWLPDVDDELRELAAAEGLTLLGVADAARDEESERAEGEFAQWLDEGRHGTMAWLERHRELKFDPARILEGTRSVVVFGLGYYQRADWSPGLTSAPVPSARATGARATGGPATGASATGASASGAARAPSARIARYAWGRDYHKELGRRLRRIARRLGERHPTEEFRPFTDATPLSERLFGERAAVGFTGRNTLLINGELGSWFVVGEILSTRSFAASPPHNDRHGACPSGCVRCIDVCPTGALEGPNRIDASRCISYLTIEHEGSIPEELRELMGDWLFGCDLCQEVCPLNVRVQATGVEGFLRPIAGSRQLLSEILAIRDDQEFVRRFAGSPLMRARRARLVRNACVVAANIGAHELTPVLESLSHDSDPVVAEHARWAVSRLRRTTT